MPYPGQEKPTNLVGETEEEREVILEAFRVHMIEEFGFVSFFKMHSYPTMRKLCEKNPAFKSRFDEIIRESNHELSKFVVKKLKNPDAPVDLGAFDRVVKHRKGWDEVKTEEKPQVTAIHIVGIESRDDAEDFTESLQGGNE